MEKYSIISHSNHFRNTCHNHKLNTYQIIKSEYISNSRTRNLPTKLKILESKEESCEKESTKRRGSKIQTKQTESKYLIPCQNLRSRDAYAANHMKKESIRSEYSPDEIAYHQMTVNVSHKQQNKQHQNSNEYDDEQEIPTPKKLRLYRSSLNQSKQEKKAEASYPHLAALNFYGMDNASDLDDDEEDNIPISFPGLQQSVLSSVYKRANDDGKNTFFFNEYTNATGGDQSSSSFTTQSNTQNVNSARRVAIEKGVLSGKSYYLSKMEESRNAPRILDSLSTSDLCLHTFNQALNAQKYLSSKKM
ncbi:hypothetical protein FGO68_gene16804 [Halteria grandinella]|uniref:Uncharacterized protein n=1 Tax=Halteria grandinella TaxID=5974 RepID=A0A8J8T341_HALGN|nr:hypothetical protein FGO68_gene16804 [Halteria grandinella]